jgi:hypothetical protein
VRCREPLLGPLSANKQEKLRNVAGGDIVIARV